SSAAGEFLLYKRGQDSDSADSAQIRHRKARASRPAVIVRSGPQIVGCQLRKEGRRQRGALAPASLSWVCVAGQRLVAPQGTSRRRPGLDRKRRIEAGQQGILGWQVARQLRQQSRVLVALIADDDRP